MRNSWKILIGGEEDATGGAHLASVLPNQALRYKQAGLSPHPENDTLYRRQKKPEMGSNTMDWDDARPKPSKNASIGDNLETLSVAELETRIAEFSAEIERVKAELTRKRDHENAAAALFKKPGV